jgi:P pilus assembly chaperone PapD
MLSCSEIVHGPRSCVFVSGCALLFWKRAEVLIESCDIIYLADYKPVSSKTLNEHLRYNEIN